MTTEPNHLNDPPTDPQTPPDNNKPNGNDPAPVEISLKNPAVLALVEAARKQEKDKLYKTLDSKDEQLKVLEAKVTDLEKQLSEKDGANMEELKQLQDTIKTMQEQQAELLKTIQDEKEAAAREKEILEAQRQAANLKAFKEAALREAGDDLIVELVGGESEDEITASIEKAKTKYQEIVTKVSTKEPKKADPKNLPKVTNPPAGNPPTFTKEDVMKMSKADFEKNRDQIMDLARKGLI